MILPCFFLSKQCWETPSSSKVFSSIWCMISFIILSDLIGVSCYLIAIWNCIFLITSGAEHPFCLLPSVHCHWLSVCSNILPIFKQFFLISLVSCERSLPFLYRNHLSDIYFARYQFATCFCILLIVSFK